MVSLVAVEEVMGKVLPESVECCVVEIPDVTKGARIIAVVTGEVEKKPVLHKMSKELPNIALPREFILMSDLPKMGSGKVDFRKVTEIVKQMRQKNEK
jgi:acyl-[acyl-carrier-protein]-phospholipid O-acyltransferase/long-chain-fatty-acid--[acyl-carrier-protein] ligase